MISTHILDTSLGMPARDVPVLLEKKTKTSSWETLSNAKTNLDGRIIFNNKAEEGEYKLTFFIEDYFFKLGHEPFFLNIPITFKVLDASRNYHIPLLLNPYGHSIYRGS